MNKAIYLGVAAALVSTVAIAQGAPRGGGMMKAADANGDGTITWAEAQAASSKRFAALDANRDGKVSQEERKRDRDVTSAEFAERAKKRFDRVDANKDGKLDATELAAVKERRGRGHHGRRG